MTAPLTSDFCTRCLALSWGNDLKGCGYSKLACLSDHLPLSGTRVLQEPTLGNNARVRRTGISYQAQAYLKRVPHQPNGGCPYNVGPCFCFCGDVLASCGHTATVVPDRLCVPFFCYPSPNRPWSTAASARLLAAACMVTRICS